MSQLQFSLFVLMFATSTTTLHAADPPPAGKQAVELVGRAAEFWSVRAWNSYFWDGDFTFVLQQEATKNKWRVISRQATPHYQWRMGPTYTGLSVDWSKNPRVKVLGITGVDRVPEDFYYYRLDEPNILTALVVLIETEHDVWKEFFVNNWFHHWSDEADRAVYRAYAGKPLPYDIYGFIQGAVAPFSKKSQALIDQHPTARCYHGLARATTENAYGYEVELVHLTGPGNVLFGDPQTLPVLDDRAPPRFQDVTARSGLNVVPKVGYDDCKPHAVAVEDFDGDGLPDIVLAGFDAPHIRYYRNLGRLQFEDITQGSGLEPYVGTASGMAVGDYDRDGRLDLFIGSLRPGESRLFRGTGGGRFADVTKESGAYVRGAARSCAWSDIDGDGWIDLYVTNPSGANALFRNDGRGKFVDIAAAAGVALPDKMSLGCAFDDVDGDGRDDLFVANYHSQPSTLLKNLGGGKFRDVTTEAGLARRASAVGCTLGDVFNRGRLDLYVTTDSWLSGANSTDEQLRKQGHTVEPNVLNVNDGQGRFAPLDEPTFDFQSLSHDAIIEDLDHDGHSEIYVGVDADSGNSWATTKGGNPLWTRVDGRWREVGNAWGLDHQANTVCMAPADFDNDGDLDLLVVNFYSNVVLYRNGTNDKNWLRVKAIGTRSNPDGIGAQVSVFRGEAAEKKLVAFRHIQSGVGYARCSPLEAHLGLGSPPAADYRVEVFFPASKSRLAVDGVKPGQRLVVRESEEKE